MLVRHDAELRVVTTCGLSMHGDPCNDTTVEARVLDAHMAVQAVMHGKVSGHDSGIRVSCSYSLVNPDRDVLGDGKLCTCSDCMKEDAR